MIVLGARVRAGTHSIRRVIQVTENKPDVACERTHIVYIVLLVPVLGQCQVSDIDRDARGIEDKVLPGTDDARRWLTTPRNGTSRSGRSWLI